MLTERLQAVLVILSLATILYGWIIIPWCIAAFRHQKRKREAKLQGFPIIPRD